MASWSAWLRPRQQTVRMRLALFCGALFLVTGALLLFLTDAFYATGSTSVVRVGSGASGAPVAGQQHSSDLHQLLVYSAVALAITGVLAVPLGWLVADRLLRPLRVITARARSISAANLHERLAIQGPGDEFKELGETLDELFGRLEASFASQRRFVANASHELRTPLTVERTLLQVALANPRADAERLRTTCEKLLAQNDQQQRLLGALLTLASSEGGVERWEGVDLGAVVEHVVTQHDQDARHRGLRVKVSLGAAQAVGDPDLLESLVANLVDNGIRHNVDGGFLQVVTESRAGRAVISVTNSGPVVSPEDVQALLEPFRRSVDRIHIRGGHGLGLSIVRAVADAHGATLSVKPCPDGGLRVEVDFPARNSARG